MQSPLAANRAPGKGRKHFLAARNCDQLRPLSIFQSKRPSFQFLRITINHVDIRCAISAVERVGSRLGATFAEPVTYRVDRPGA